MSKLKLYDRTGKMLLKVDTAHEIDRGGEGMILPHPNDAGLVLKIYHDGIVPTLNPDSWNYLKLLGSRFIKPQQLLYDSAGQLIGFTMVLLDRSFFRMAQLFTRSLCVKEGINENIKSRIVDELISVVDEAHCNDIVIGDLNPYNIFVNKLGEIRLIDVDSYQTPVQAHTGRLLDDIRDHYYLGAVSRESDYYGLAVNVFRMLTYVHPYKGVHRSFKTIEERAINRISVLRSDADLIVPSFYEPIADKQQELQFFRMFEKGERFLISSVQPGMIKTSKSVVVNSADSISTICIAQGVLECYFNQSLGYVKTQQETVCYDASVMGRLKELEHYENVSYDSLWVGNKNILRLKDGKVYCSNTEIENFEMPANFRFVQLEHLVLGVDWENIYYLEPDKIINGKMAWQKTAAWGRGFRFESSPTQLTGGVDRMHYRLGNVVNSVKLPVKARSINTQGHVGVITWVEKESIKHHWFRVDGLSFKMCKETDEIYSFALKHVAGTDYVFVPKDGLIEILRATDFDKVDTIPFGGCTLQSQIFLTQSGLLLLESGVLYLINRK